MNWHSLTKDISYGHDIEGSWLLYEAALASGDEIIISKVTKTALAIAEVIYTTAIDHTNNGLFSGCNEAGFIHTKKEWWSQAEAVVGFYNAYELSGDQKYLKVADVIWSYIQNHFVDRTHGEWHNELSLDNTPDTSMPKAGFWKCPYHNARACFEVVGRIPVN
jgi:mannobiose 2-epimerase